MKLIKLASAYEVFKTLLTVEMPIKQSFNLTSLVLDMEKNITIYQQKRDELIKKYGIEVPDNPGQYKITTEKQEAFNTELQELNDVEIAWDRKITLSNVTITPADLYKIMDFVEVE